MTTTQPPKDILNLDHLIGKRVHVKFLGGREGLFEDFREVNSLFIVEGILKGYDQLVNLVLEEATEQFPTTKRKLGSTVCRGPSVMLVCPEDGYEEIANPFLSQEE